MSSETHSEPAWYRAPKLEMGQSLASLNQDATCDHMAAARLATGQYPIPLIGSERLNVPISVQPRAPAGDIDGWETRLARTVTCLHCTESPSPVEQ